MDVELGIWEGRYANQILPWLRWWDKEGNLLLSSDERAKQEQQRADEEKQRADEEKQRRERLEAFLRSQGFNPDQLPKS
jgi:transposase-like protein